MPTPDEIAQICTEINDFNEGVRKNEEASRLLKENPNLILYSLLLTMKKSNKNQKYLTLCVLYIAISAMVIPIISNINNQNFLIIIAVLVLALIPLSIAAKETL